MDSFVWGAFEASSSKNNFYNPFFTSSMDGLGATIGSFLTK